MPPPDNSARARTIRRMQTLVVASTLAVGCKDSSFTGGGYAVVDPMPPPAQCPGIAAEGKVTAKWKRVTPVDGGDGWAIEVTISTPDRAHAAFSEVTAATSWHLTALTTTVNSATFELTPGTDQFLYFQIGVTCGGDGAPPLAGRIQVSIPVGKPGTPIAPTLSDT